MLKEKDLEQIVREVMRSMQGEAAVPAASAPKVASGKLDPDKDYPLAQKRPDLVKTGGGLSVADITLDKVISGEVKASDIKITPQVLEYQAQIAEGVGRNQFAANLRRAAELTAIPDARVLEMYNALRPYRSTKAELIAIADELEQKYGAKVCAGFVREAADVYDRRRRLKDHL